MLDSQEKLVGIDLPLEQLLVQLDLEATDVRFIGIWGMGGIGKTTLAKRIFQRICHDFEHCVFLSDVRKDDAKHGNLVNLQRQLLLPTLKNNMPDFYELMASFYSGGYLSNKKVLLVLDDVDQSNQLETLAGRKDWFGEGSRIIVTTRNKGLLDEHGVEISYEVKALNDDKALALFALNAFRKDQPEEDFLELSQRFLYYAKGLPLALKILGRSVQHEDRRIWESRLENLGTIPIPKIYDVLKVSFDGLEEVEKMIFLDVACILKETEKERVIEKLDRLRGISSLSFVDVLIKKSLFTIEKYGLVEWVIVHDLVREMAYEIVTGESKDPGLRSRLWNLDDTSNVFMNNTGTRAIEAIVARMETLEEVSHWNCKALCEMHGLRLLEFHNLIISSCPEFLPHSLRILSWNFYPSKALPPSFRPHYLTELRMPRSKFVQLWDGPKNLPNLKFMNLDYCDKLKSTPDFTGIPNLEELSMTNCSNLVDVHSSITFLKKLRHLRLDGCISLKSTPDFTGIPNLEELNMSNCSNLVDVHSSITFLRKLRYLGLHGCISLKSLPSEIEMDSLEAFGFRGCSKVKRIPEFRVEMKMLLELYLDGIAIEQIPSSIGNVVGLTELYIEDCKSLLGLPSAICNLKSLTSLVISGCPKVEKLPGEMESLTYLYWARGATNMREPLVLMKKLQSLHLCGFRIANSKSSISLVEGIGTYFGGLLGIRKSEPQCWRSVLSSLNRLSSLVDLDLSENNIGEGDIPDDIGYLSCLEVLNLSGNNFVNLPASVGSLSNLRSLDLTRCKRLRQLPDLPFSTSYVSLNDCSSLERLSDPASKWKRRSPIVDNIRFSCCDCLRLVEEDEGSLVMNVFSRIIKNVERRSYPFGGNYINVWPGSEIPEWFNQRSVGGTINVKTRRNNRNSMMGIAFCVALAPKWKDNPAAATQSRYEILDVVCSSTLLNTGSECHRVGRLMSQNLFISYLPRLNLEKASIISSHNHEVSFNTQCYSKPGWSPSQRLSCAVKKCGARVVYGEDLEQLRQLVALQTCDKCGSRVVYEEDLEQLGQSAAPQVCNECGSRVVYKEDLEQLRQSAALQIWNKQTHDDDDGDNHQTKEESASASAHHHALQICNKRTHDDDDGDNHQDKEESAHHHARVISKRRKQSL